jgi:hypothetical protein
MPDQSGPHGEGTESQESAYFRRREGSGKEAQRSAPWMPDKIWKPKVKKVGVEKLEEL